MHNYYHILGISNNATQSEIKAAFKKLALKYHPDKNNGDELMEEQFKKVNLAYQVLSNAFEKAKYDITLMYSQNTASSSTSTFTSYNQHTYAPPTPTKRQYTEPKINWRENWIATGYAFGFTLVVATFVMIGLSIKNHIAEKDHQEKLAIRRAIFNNAKQEFEKENIEDALMSLNSLGFFMSEERDMKEYKINVFESFVYEGESNFNHGNFERAINYFELIEKYSPSTPLTLKEHLAKSYQATNQPHKAIKLLKELLTFNYRHLEIYVSLAEIYRDMISNNEESLRYFRLADALAIKKYEAIYGKAYPLIMNGKYLPPVHYRLYSGLADIYLQMGNPEKAVKATKWNVIVWPDSSKCFITAALGYKQLGISEKACDNYHQAIILGASTLPNFDCQ